MAAQITETKKSSRLWLALVAVVVLAAVMMPAYVLWISTSDFRRSASQRKIAGEIVEIPEGCLIPSQVLEDKAAYKNTRMTLAGRVEMTAVTCRRQECPTDDECCGCPQERDLILKDFDKELLKDTAWRMKLLDQDKNSFCRREAGSCDYVCDGWTEGDIYLVEGTFFADPPPPGSGWRIYEDVHFEVNRFSLLRKGSGWDWPGRVVNALQELVGSLKKQNDLYVIQ